MGGAKAEDRQLQIGAAHPAASGWGEFHWIASLQTVRLSSAVYVPLDGAVQPSAFKLSDKN